MLNLLIHCQKRCKFPNIKELDYVHRFMGAGNKKIGRAG